MVLVYVPEGDFLMGAADADNYASDNEKPQRSIYLDSFWIDQTEVTQGMYFKCSAAECVRPLCPGGNANDPMINVTWNNAQAYCAWAGRRLPSEAEWEKAARGPNGLIYPWGDTAPDDTTANFSRNVDWFSEAGSYPVDTSPYGALDMAGNVREWVNDWYGEYLQNSPRSNPPGPETGDSRVLRGGAWDYNDVALRTTYRFYGEPSHVRGLDTGFRCAVSASK